VGLKQRLLLAKFNQRSKPAKIKMPDEVEQINTIAHKFGQKLIKAGSDMIRAVFKLKPAIYNRSQILTFLNDQTGIPTSSISLADEKYHIVGWDKWLQIMEFDLIDQQQYLTDVFDCENFALAYSSLAAMNYRLNSCGVAFGNIYDPTTNKLLFRHGFNFVIIYDFNGEMKCYIYEPQTDEWGLVEKGKYTILPILNWQYRPDWLLFY